MKHAAEKRRFSSVPRFINELDAGEETLVGEGGEYVIHIFLDPGEILLSSLEGCRAGGFERQTGFGCRSSFQTPFLLFWIEGVTLWANGLSAEASALAQADQRWVANPEQ
jgi:hypothetical protein